MKETEFGFYKENADDKIWWVETSNSIGEYLFTFDKKTIFNFFSDYPDKLTKEQIEIFKKRILRLRN